ncbi:aminopeptidase [Sediminitomix flava]|uniref:Putative aminopeptidase n=1 Tax=Sediminitomix flava TaxID=379075 RepID=A0A315ZNK4_SEDFL|nr:aminopeptidase [Sediminitomix flava]PWJ36089.1 putative aminopeptidase [Sediminitomix flava]
MLNKKRILKILFSVGILLSLSFLIIHYQSVVYGWGQLKGQVKILTSAQPISKYTNDEKYPQILKDKIALIQDIKKFTVNSLGLNPSNSYEKMFDQQDKPILWVVTACPPFEMKAVRWMFPIAGSFSYKGFFEYDKAVAEEKIWKNQGFDTDIREVSAWSTLGFLNDPILSSMLKRSEASLANLIIHELTHGTIFIKSNISYNENLASFIGDEGAKLYLKDKYGEQSEKYTNYSLAKEDRSKFTQYIIQSSQSLNQLYESFDSEMNDEEKNNLKQAKIEEIVANLDTVSFHNPNYRNYFDQEELPNNTFFMGFIRYREKQNEFRKEWEEKFDKDLYKYIAHLKEKYPSFWSGL